MWPAALGIHDAPVKHPEREGARQHHHSAEQHRQRPPDILLTNYVMLEPQRYDHTCGNHDWFVHDLLLMPLDKSRNEEVRRFANRMIGDHSSVNDQACFAFSMSRLSAVYTMWAICGDQRSQRDHGSQLNQLNALAREPFHPANCLQCRRDTLWNCQNYRVREPGAVHSLNFGGA